jgi:monoamine oxidase
MAEVEIAIIGAGAAGLMAGRELARAGKQVLILEARERLGGRIEALDTRVFGYPAEGGAEYVHGVTPLTHRLAQEAGLTLMPREGEAWSALQGRLSRRPTDPQFSLVLERMERLGEDLPLARFLEHEFGGVEFVGLRAMIRRMAEGYDAADPELVSTLALKDEWTDRNNAEQKRIRQGYGALVAFLAAECRRHGATIRTSAEVMGVELGKNGLRLLCADGETHGASRAIVTVPLPLLQRIRFTPPLPEKQLAAAAIGFGGVIKLLLRFETRWWEKAGGQDLSRMFLVLSHEAVPTWWTQYPQAHAVLTGWMSGPRTARHAAASDAELVELGLGSLAGIFAAPAERLREDLRASHVANWPADPFALGGYSFATPEAPAARAELLRPVENRLWFAGEALFRGREFATVEAALDSGAEAARGVLAA